MPHSRRPRRIPLTPPIARRLVADIVGAASAQVDLEYTLADHWDLVNTCWPRERRTVIREIMYRRYSWY